MNITAEAKELLRNAKYGDGLATVHTQDCEALEAAVKHSDAIAPKLAEALRKARKVLKNRGGSTGYECLKEVNAALAEWDAQ